MRQSQRRCADRDQDRREPTAAPHPARRRRPRVWRRRRGAGGANLAADGETRGRTMHALPGDRAGDSRIWATSRRRLPAPGAGAGGFAPPASTRRPPGSVRTAARASRRPLSSRPPEPLAPVGLSSFTTPSEPVRWGCRESVRQRRPESVCQGRLESVCQGRPESVCQGRLESVCQGRPESVCQGRRRATRENSSQVLLRRAQASLPSVHLALARFKGAL